MARILIHSIVFKPDGVSTAYLYADLVSELKKLGHEIVVLTSTPHYNIVEEAIRKQPLKRRGLFYYESNFEGVPVYHIPMSKSKFTLKRIFDFVKFHVLALYSITFLKKIDIVLSPSPPLTIGIISYWIARIKKAKSIYNVQEIYPDFAINQGIIRNKLMIRLLKGMETYIYDKSSAVVTIDDNFSRIIAPRFKDKTKLSVIPNFIDTTLYAPHSRNNSFSEKHGLNNRFVIGYAGNIGFAQNWEPIIFAAERFKNSEISFLIIGDGVKKKWLKEQIALKGLHNIILLDYQPREQMPLINAAADVHTIVMSPEMDNDGFPSKIYAIMASARPVIVSTGKNSPLKNMLDKAGYHRTVPLNDNEAYADAILKAYNEKAQLPEEGLKGRNFILENYSKEAISLQYDKLINEITAKK